MQAQFAILELALPGQTPVPAGVLLLDPESNRLHVRLRRDWEAIAPDEADVLELIEDDLKAKSAPGDLGGAGLLGFLESCLSGILRVSEREMTLVSDYDRALSRLYRQYVPGPRREFITHLPFYTARVAAGKFLDDQEVEPDSWVEVPEGMRLDPRMFVVEIIGRSMEPRIPDGSLAVFRAGVMGSRQGKLLLVERRDVSESGGRYTVKRYVSEKKESAEGEWRHTTIRLEPLNPEFDAWELEEDPDRFRIIGEFVAVIEG